MSNIRNPCLRQAGEIKNPQLPPLSMSNIRNPKSKIRNYRLSPCLISEIRNQKSAITALLLATSNKPKPKKYLPLRFIL